MAQLKAQLLFQVQVQAPQFYVAPQPPQAQLIMAAQLVNSGMEKHALLVTYLTIGIITH